MAERHNTTLDEMESFPPTVDRHTTYKDGYKLHTIDPDPDTDIDVYND